MILHMTEYERRMHILVWQYFLLEKNKPTKRTPSRQMQQALHRRV